jgi:hypothetical protein
MGGRTWHWVAASAASLAVVGALLANDTGQQRGTVTATTFPTVSDYQPDYGQAVIATPPLNASSVTKTTSTAPPVKPTTTPPPPPPPQPPADDEHKDKDPTLTISLPLPTLPVFYPNCHVARALGAAPIHKGQPGYRIELDRNRNDIACER